MEERGEERVKVGHGRGDLGGDAKLERGGEERGGGAGAGTGRGG